MTTDDLAWVQSRLRNCTNARRQLRICAECLCVDEGTLLESLGYASLDAFRAVHPQNKRSCGPSVERIYNPVPPEVMLESILYYYSGAPISSVCRMMGYTQTVTPEAIRHRVCSWKKKHPALAAGMPHKRPKPKKETKPMKMTYDEAGLPAYAYARSRYTNNIVRIVRGERTLFGVVEQETVDTLNDAAGVTRAQAAAMYGGAMCGWDSPMADPKNYNEAGAYIGPEMEDKHGEE
ncbi:hypothetical protein [Gemmiger formicilis]|uniref:hypothetical protein n=1 Tax=Gemmiger formicilis TaxID=745368 RepID=UPI003995E227